MKLYPDKLIGRNCTGIYIGPDAVIAATASRTLRNWEVKSVSAQINKSEDGFSATPGNIIELKDNLAKLLSVNPVSGEVQIAFDDRYVRFFVVPLSEMPGSKEVDNILQWHAEKILQTPAQYDYAAQLVETPSGFRIYGAAVMSAFVNTIGEVMQSHNLPWYMADSAASYVWNDFDEQYKQGASVHIGLGRYGWTLIACDANGSVELIKPGRWSYNPDGSPQIRNGLIEANRLLTTFIDMHPQAKPERVYIDIGEHQEGADIAQEFFGEDLAKVQSGRIPSLFSESVPRQYSYELSIAMKASIPR